MIQSRSKLLKSSLIAIQVGLFLISQHTFFPTSSPAQQSFSLPKPVKPVPPPAQLPRPTFGIGNPIPNQNPPVTEENISRQFSVYRLDVDDVVSVNVEQFPEFNFIGPIDSEGNILVPILGRVSIAGLTLEEVETKISVELGNRFLLTEPVVFAVLATPRPVRVTLIGEVSRPGFYTVDSTTLLSDILSFSGGTTNTADLRNVIVRRSLSDGSVIEQRIDLYTPLITGSNVPKVPLQGGDTVIVSRLEIGDDQDYDRVLISRSTLPVQEITVRLLAPVQPSGQVLQNLVLPNGSDFLDIIAAVPLADVLRVNVTDVTLLRFDPERGRVITQSLNIRAILNGDLSYVVPLQEGDVVVVGRTLLGKVFAAFNVLTQPIRDLESFWRVFNRGF
ncbi:polysaccharide biosynthesis/export family protein [Gloeocapsa sp. PCC 73106]|uniref:polysaccharide biosynthesis/export family protein n=1 Tax=Gloeocapsa sp. PCC 73106 TaxID=102232 RepID=UPI00130E1CDA|nr:polysaccharide biosynthesis/export family protein [Gloeocapsa sp. PCC 73106]